MEEHFDLTLTETSFSHARRAENIIAEAAFDALSVIRSSVPKETITAGQLVPTSKSLAQVERAFRSLKCVDLHVSPIYHFDGERIRVHVFLCMLDYYVEWHMHERLRELLFDDDERKAARNSRRLVVAPTKRSKSARVKMRLFAPNPVFPFRAFRIC